MLTAALSKVRLRHDEDTTESVAHREPTHPISARPGERRGVIACGGPGAGGLPDADLMQSKEDLLRRWASYHEAGHAVAAWRRGLSPGGLGLVVGHRGRGVYYHGWMLWRLLVAPPELVRGTVLAGVEVFQAGLLAEYLCGSECNLHDASSVRRELNPLLDCHVPGYWWDTCRNIRLTLGCGPDELDDAQRALLLLLVYSSRDEGPLVGEPHDPGAIDRAYRLAPATPEEISCTYLASQRRVLRALRRPRAWRAIEDMAGELFDLGRVAPGRAVEIMEATRVPRSGLPVDALPFGPRPLS